MLRCHALGTGGAQAEYVGMGKRACCSTKCGRTSLIQLHSSLGVSMFHVEATFLAGPPENLLHVKPGARAVEAAGGLLGEGFPAPTGKIDPVPNNSFFFFKGALFGVVSKEKKGGAPFAWGHPQVSLVDTRRVPFVNPPAKFIRLPEARLAKTSLGGDVLKGD